MEQASLRCAVDVRGDTALHEAAGGGYEPAARILLAGRANPNAVGQSGETPLIRAARRGHKNVVEVGTPCQMHTCTHLYTHHSLEGLCKGGRHSFLDARLHTSVDTSTVQSRGPR